MIPKRVAVIGAGPSGIVSAKFLLQNGLQPEVFEQSDQPGGQWHVRNSLSGIWPGMPTNTSRIMTQFSDLDHLPAAPTFPSAAEMQDYLQRYIDVFKLQSCLRLNSPVTLIQPEASGGWRVQYQSSDGGLQDEVFDFVLIASGRFNQPYFPEVAGLELSPRSLNGPAIFHSHQYMGPGQFHGQRVLVAGGAISALEIASDLVLHGGVEVVSSYRSQRYVLRKLAGGVPTDHINFTLYQALAAERLDPALIAARMRDWAVESFGNPEDFGARRPDDDLRIAGTTKCEHFLDLVADQRIRLRPWLDRIEGRTVHFSDGSKEQVDAIIFATGYHLNLPFLRPEETLTLGLGQQQIDLYQHSFHPDLPGLGIIGFYNQVGPYFPILELQARWIAAVWSGLLAAPDQEQMQAGLREYRQSWAQQQKMPMHKLALLFGRALGVEPQPERWPELERELWFGPLCPALFRLSGPDALSDAPERVLAAAREFDMVPGSGFTETERQRLQAISARFQ